MDAVQREPISPAVVAEIRDANDNLADLAPPVTLTIETNPRGGTLSGITTVDAVGGVASFNGLSIDKPATDYTLTAASGTLASATSEPFSIAKRICTLTPTARPLPTGQGGSYTVDESRIPDFTGTLLLGDEGNSLGSLLGSVVADLNNDGLDDLIYSGPMFRFVEIGVPVTILANDGAGNFVDATTTIIAGPVPAPVHSRQTITADFNGDGATDVFFANLGVDVSPGPGELNTLLLSDGTGQVVDSPANIHDVVGFTHSAAAGDIDCDGDIDIYVGTMGSNATSVPNYFLINDGTGNFAVHPDYLPELVRFFPDGLHPDWASAAIADLDGDNFPELVLGGGGPPPSDRLTETIILWNDGTGNFDSAEFTQLPAVPGFGGSADVFAMDIDGDGDLDLFFSIDTGNVRGLQVMVNNGDRTFTDETDLRVFGLSGDGDFILHTLPIDFNGDGAPDLLLQSEDFQGEGYHELIFINDGSGVFTALDNQAIANKTGMLFPVDADGDGGLDFIVWNAVFPRVDFDFSLLVHP